ncbi:MAG: hypothetical protein JSU07_04330 [Bacteroidetes bacterium]|nr:hypothetical protein [Bacteroidota bacterium]
MLIFAIASLTFTSCKLAQLTSQYDDAYADPAQEHRAARIAAINVARTDSMHKAKALAAQQAKDAANPYYKDPQYNKDDYYDYQYASRLRRFQGPINGAGYYDNYYTNSYYYNQNPAMYGNSIYNTYAWMPSNQFAMCGSGISNMYGYGGGYGMGYGSPYGYGMGYGSPYGYGSGYGMGYGSPYGYGGGYGMGYGYGGGPYMSMGYGYNSMGYGYPYMGMGMGGYGYSPYGGSFYNSYGNWGYYNSYDPNSGYSHYGPRGSFGGNNGGRSTTAGMAVPYDLESNAREKFFNQMAVKQEATPRFVEVQHKQFNNNMVQAENSGYYNSGGRPAYNNNGMPRNASINNSNINENKIDNTPREYNANNNGGFWPRSNNNSGNVESTPRSFNQSPQIESKPVRSFEPSPSFNTNNESFNRGGGFGGGSFGGGGGGGFRRR